MFQKTLFRPFIFTPVVRFVVEEYTLQFRNTILEGMWALASMQLMVKKSAQRRTKVIWLSLRRSTEVSSMASRIKGLDSKEREEGIGR